LIERSSLRYITSQRILRQFDCGNDQVNQYLWHQAIQDEKHHTRSTTIYLDGDRIVAYYTISTGVIDVKTGYDRLIFNRLRALPSDNNQQINLPVVEISWLGVDTRWQRQHLGAKLIYDCFDSVLKLRFDLNIGTIGIVVSSLSAALDFYKQYAFKYLHYDYDNQAMFPKTYPLFVSTESLKLMMTE